jgi:hypothetical protein
MGVNVISLQCPQCGATVQDGAELCPHCGAGLRITHTPEGRQVELIGAICLSCGKNNRSDDEYCGECGVALVRECPSCGRKSPLGSKHCTKCGLDFRAYEEEQRRELERKRRSEEASAIQLKQSQTSGLKRIEVERARLGSATAKPSHRYLRKVSLKWYSLVGLALAVSFALQLPYWYGKWEMLLLGTIVLGIPLSLSALYWLGVSLFFPVQEGHELIREMPEQARPRESRGQDVTLSPADQPRRQGCCQ